MQRKEWFIQISGELTAYTYYDNHFGVSDSVVNCNRLSSRIKTLHAVQRKENTTLVEEKDVSAYRSFISQKDVVDINKLLLFLDIMNF